MTWLMRLTLGQTSPHFPIVYGFVTLTHDLAVIWCVWNQAVALIISLSWCITLSHFHYEKLLSGSDSHCEFRVQDNNLFNDRQEINIFIQIILILWLWQLYTLRWFARPHQKAPRRRKRPQHCCPISSHVYFHSAKTRLCLSTGRAIPICFRQRRNWKCWKGDC